ncbi:MarR family winged helix-turn-helix transcriptional regulator [Magnetofaba australis]|uniref:Putative TrmB family transcriptional regulator n=1 Tax=Magnetofaba australis IT-1 TaxID=1434232 RepID=A0A1Y2K920_9PROT|nr:MarR family winged helix-turn-helix transcriptional regulator [Magnetofaba australis]OSM07241.1 putative TrmB family transcriptional regulator [Magnetofaba australis IT-1]
MSNSDSQSDLRNQVRNHVLMTLRKIIRAIDMHSRYLVANHGLTGPQAVILSEILNCEKITGAQLGKRVHLSKGTISGIVARLESKGLVERRRSQTDRRRFWLSATPQARTLLENAPPLLQQAFVRKFDQLPDYEQTAMLTTLLRIADMMGAEDIDAAPLLGSGDLLPDDDALEAEDSDQ